MLARLISVSAATLAGSRTRGPLAARCLRARTAHGALWAGLAVLGVPVAVAPAMGQAPALQSPNPSSSQNLLQGVSVVSASDAWAVGYYLDNTTGLNHTLIVHWNGTAWSRVQAPNPGSIVGPGDNALYGVSAVSASDAWAVGYSSINGAAHTLILHWNGTAWSKVTSPNPSSSNNLEGVNAVSASDAWAVGYYRNNTTGVHNTLILHWNGTAWSKVTSPNPSSSDDNELSGVSAVSASDAWAVGGSVDPATDISTTMIAHWNGTAWSAVTSPNPGSTTNGLAGVSALSPSDAWAFGGYFSDSTNSGDTMIAHWNGTAWSTVTTPNPGYGDEAYGMSADSASDAWAVGSYLTHTTGAAQTLILHWNGTAWSTVTSPNPSSGSNALYGVSAESASDAWAVGYYRNDTTSAYDTLILHWNGTAWSKA